MSCVDEVWIGQDGIFSPTSDKLTNVSANGMFIQTKESFAPGAVVNVRFNIGDSGVTVSSSAVVRNPQPGVGLGVEFLDLSPEDQRHLETFIAGRLV